MDPRRGRFPSRARPSRGPRAQAAERLSVHEYRPRTAAADFRRSREIDHHGHLETRLSSAQAQVLSGPSLTKLIRCFGLYDFKQVTSFCGARLESEDIGRDFVPEAAWDRMREDVTIEPVRGDGVDGPPVAITISYRGSQPQTVAEVTNALTSSYVRENEKMRSNQAHGTAHFLARQLAELSVRLEVLESNAGAFKMKHIEELPERLDAYLEALDELRTQMSTNSEDRNRAGERRGDLETDVEVEGLGAEAAALKQQIARYEARMEAMPRVQQEYQVLAREQETAYEGYKSLAARLREAELAASVEDMQIGERLRVIERALPPKDPIEPKRAQLYALALVLALAAATLVVLMPGVGSPLGRGSVSPSDDGPPPQGLPLA